MCEVVDFDYPESVDNLVGFTAKQVDRMGSLTKEIISIPKNYGKVNGRTDAFELTKILSGSNNTWVKRAGKFGEENMTIGFQTIGNPKKEWYIDFDATTGKGAHYNWSDGVNRGAVLFNGTENIISQLKQQLTSTYGTP